MAWTMCPGFEIAITACFLSFPLSLSCQTMGQTDNGIDKKTDRGIDKLTNRWTDIRIDLITDKWMMKDIT